MPYRRKKTASHCSRCDIKPGYGRKISSIGFVRLCDYCLELVKARIEEEMAKNAESDTQGDISTKKAKGLV